MGIFDQIKNAFSSGSEEPVKKEETVAPASEPAPQAAEQPAAEPPAPSTYTVQSGDTLWKIAETVYGDGSEHQKIFEANQDLLESPDRIFPGQELTIP